MALTILDPEELSPMTEIEFQNRRFDPDLTPFHELAKSMAKAFGYTADLELDVDLAQLLRLRVAQKNNCSYCLILHTEAARDREIHQAKIDGLGSWWESSLYTGPDRAALAYCDALNEGDQPGFQANTMWSLSTSLTAASPRSPRS